MGGLFSIENPFWHFINRLLSLFLLNVLWFLCSIPVITAGASTTAVYYVTQKMVRNEEGYLTKSFFTAFSANFKQATVVWLIILMIGGILGVDLIVYLRISHATLAALIFMMSFFAFAVLFVFECTYVFAILARFDNTIIGALGNALLMSVRHLPSSILMVAADIILTALGFFIFPPILLLGLPLTAWIHSFFLNRIFRQYEQPDRFRKTT